MKKRPFRDNGAVGALLDEYEKSITELCTCIAEIDSDSMKIIVDPHTSDQDCKSIQTILTHVLRAGYRYSKYILEWNGSKYEEVKVGHLENTNAYILALHKMFDHCEQVFDDHPEMQIELFENEQKILSKWGQYYDVEQLMEHAIVHILRHRRQIQRFLTIISKSNAT